MGKQSTGTNEPFWHAPVKLQIFFFFLALQRDENNELNILAENKYYKKKKKLNKQNNKQNTIAPDHTTVSHATLRQTLPNWLFCISYLSFNHSSILLYLHSMNVVSDIENSM